MNNVILTHEGTDSDERVSGQGAFDAPTADATHVLVHRFTPRLRALA